MKVLAVEADPLSALLLHDALSRGGHAATIVRDASSAWARLHEPEARFDLVIASVDSPRGEGIELVQKLRSDGNGSASVPVLAALANDTPAMRRHAQSVGVNGFLAAPLEPDDVLARVNEHCRALTIPGAYRIKRGIDDHDLTGSEEEEPPPIQGRRERLGEILIRRGLINREQLNDALDIQTITREKLGTILVSKGWVREDQVAAAYSRQVDMAFVDIVESPVDFVALGQFTRAQVLHYSFLPLVPDELALGSAGEPPLRVAISDPWNIAAIDLVQSVTRRRVKPVLAEPGALKDAIELAFRSTGRTMPDDDIVRALGTSESGDAEFFDQSVEDGDDQAPIIKFVNQIIAEGVRQRASDIHIEPYKNDFEVRYRIDGHLRVAHALPRQNFSAVVSRIKVMGELDIAERRMPQDGRVTLLVEERPVQLRISTLPNQFGERVVLRILDKSATQKQLDELGFAAANVRLFQSLIARPHGIVLVTGPTGSGKTTTLYAALNALKDPSLNIMTCEDPIEYEVDRISQSNVNPKAGLTFAAQLRSILRQDPDIVLVGEVRDGETAEIAFKAAMTGHLVLSTLHCNEAAGAPARLFDMGIEPFLISSALNGSLAQRLVRRLCPHCRQSGPPTPEEMGKLMLLNGGLPVVAESIGKRSPEGCSRCSGAGTLGRLGVHELMPMTEAVQHAINRRASTAELRELAVAAGMVPMSGDGLAKVIAGEAYLDDVVKKVLTS